MRFVLSLLFFGSFIHGGTVPGSNGRWSISQDERLGDAKVAPFQGRSALWLKNNTHVVAAGEEFVDGTIEFDLAPMENGRFFAVDFRYRNFNAYENIYLRPMKSGEFDALQYSPRINGGSTWQIYPEFSAAAEYPQGQWTHVRLEVSGSVLEAFIGDAKEPTLRVPRLRADVDAGQVVVWARVNNQPTQWAAAISNFRVTPRKPTTVKAKAGEAPAGFLTDWQVAKEIHDAKDAAFILPALSEWKSVAVEESGLVNLNRHLKRSRGRKTAYVRTTILSAAAETRQLHLGFSDDVTVFLNGKALYAGRNGWESRYPGFLGLLDPNMEAIFLPLKAGKNELVIAVTDDQRFGWGLAARTSGARAVSD